MKWRDFVVAILVVGYAMLAAGAPLIAVIAGIAFAAVLNVKHQGLPKVARSKKSRTPMTPATRDEVKLALHGDGAL